MKSFFPFFPSKILRSRMTISKFSFNFLRSSFVKTMTKGWNNDEGVLFRAFGGRRKKGKEKKNIDESYLLPLPSRIVFRSFRICIAPIWKNGFHVGFTRLPRLKLCNQRNESRSSDRIYPARIYSLYNGSSFLKKKEILIQRSKT